MLRSALSKRIAALALASVTVFAALQGCSSNDKQCGDSCSGEGQGDCANGLVCAQYAADNDDNNQCIPEACGQCPLLTTCSFAHNGSACTFTSCNQ